VPSLRGIIGTSALKVHVSVDPGSELIDAVAETAANAPDREAVDDLLAPVAEMDDKPEVFADSAYADGPTLEHLEGQGFEVVARVPPASHKKGFFSKDDFAIDLGAGTVTCPAGRTVHARFNEKGEGTASFGKLCATCPLAAQCTTSKAGRNVGVHPNEEILQRHKEEQKTPEWKQRYTSTRPKVERKIGHMARKAWGGRKARCRGVARSFTDVLTRAAVVNYSRLGGWCLSRTSCVAACARSARALSPAPPRPGTKAGSEGRRQ
jgi:hypothetical protein